MRRLGSICLIDMTVPKVFIRRQSYASQPFGRLYSSVPQAFVAKGWSGGRALWDVGSRGATAWKNVPKGRIAATSNIVAKYLFKREHAFVNNPSGRFYTC
jgi:hypothetical protein